MFYLLICLFIFLRGRGYFFRLRLKSVLGSSQNTTENGLNLIKQENQKICKSKYLLYNYQCNSIISRLCHLNGISRVFEVTLSYFSILGFLMNFRDFRVSVCEYCRFSYAGTLELVNLFVGTTIPQKQFIIIHHHHYVSYENIG